MGDHHEGPLGQTSEFPAQYDRSVLHPISRAIGRVELKLDSVLPFHGVDIWNAYELSWLNEKGKPVVALMKMSVSANSENIVESKSLKLYLGSFNGSVFKTPQQVEKIIQRDVSEIVAGEVEVDLSALQQAANFSLQDLPGQCIDELDVEIDRYAVDASLLQNESSQVVSETLHSHLMRSCCPVTGQPDWASVVIEYEGAKISPQSLLRYLVSYRNNQEFHEQCVERVYMDILHHCKPVKLAVYARYTRRGGIDINPFRSSTKKECDNVRLIRQ